MTLDTCISLIVESSFKVLKHNKYVSRSKFRAVISRLWYKNITSNLFTLLRIITFVYNVIVESMTRLALYGRFEINIDKGLQTIFLKDCLVFDSSLFH